MLIQLARRGVSHCVLEGWFASHGDGAQCNTSPGMDGKHPGRYDRSDGHRMASSARRADSLEGLGSAIQERRETIAMGCRHDGDHRRRRVSDVAAAYVARRSIHGAQAHSPFLTD